MKQTRPGTLAKYGVGGHLWNTPYHATETLERKALRTLDKSEIFLIVAVVDQDVMVLTARGDFGWLAQIVWAEVF